MRNVRADMRLLITARAHTTRHCGHWWSLSPPGSSAFRFSFGVRAKQLADLVDSVPQGPSHRRGCDFPSTGTLNKHGGQG